MRARVSELLVRARHKLFPLPWWTLFVGYAIAFAAVGASVYMIVVFGAVLGEYLTSQWLVALLVGTLHDILIKEPLKVLHHISKEFLVHSC